MGVTTANPSDRASLMALWKSVFADEDIFLQAFFRLRFSPDRCFLLRREDKIISALHTFPVTLMQKGSPVSALYIVGAATLPDFRRQGAMTQLLSACAKKNRGTPLLLYPAVRNFYEQNGYQTAGEYTEIQLPHREEEPVFPKPVTGKALHALYMQQLLSCGSGIVRDPVSWHFALQEGRCLSATGRDYAILEGKICREAAAEDETAAEKLLDLLQKAGAETLLVRQGSIMEKACAHLPGRVHPAGMACTNGGLTAPDLFVDEIY